MKISIIYIGVNHNVWAPWTHIVAEYLFCFEIDTYRKIADDKYAFVIVADAS